MQPAGIVREERTVLAAKENGKKVKDVTEQFWAKGSSYVDLLFLFDKQNEKCFDYKLSGVGKIKGRNVYALEILQKKADIGEENIKKDENVSWDIKYKGVALIDAETMEIVQLNKDGVNLNYIGRRIEPFGANPLYTIDWGPYVDRYIFFTQYEYDKVKVKDQSLILPATKIVKLFRGNGQLYTTYKYRYSDHKAFDVDVKIKFDEMK